MYDDGCDEKAIVFTEQVGSYDTCDTVVTKVLIGPSTVDIAQVKKEFKEYLQTADKDLIADIKEDIKKYPHRSTRKKMFKLEYARRTRTLERFFLDAGCRNIQHEICDEYLY